MQKINLFFSLILIFASYSMAVAADTDSPLLLFYSGNIHGETEACG